ncbi:DUF3826 domain-containing protein [Dinghuibacter silviterrae]|nr:DUF3826 domain-containing protein [Dinghuibacter silviterrae]
MPLLLCTRATAAGEDSAYIKTIFLRSQKIVNQLDLTDTAKASRVRDMVSWQYRHLNAVYADKKDQNDKSIDSLHLLFLKELSTELTPAQIDKVKDGMTYSVLEVTYNAYCAELPALTDPQKAQILAWLTEAREHAMDAGSSEKKHAWFGKYKGRINNYLSAQGYTLK